MNIELFEQLLYEEENSTLDFKKEQYRFAKATEDEKSELLKDILGFANAWRRSEAGEGMWSAYRLPLNWMTIRYSSS